MCMAGLFIIKQHRKKAFHLIYDFMKYLGQYKDIFLKLILIQQHEIVEIIDKKLHQALFHYLKNGLNIYFKNNIHSKALFIK